MHLRFLALALLFAGRALAAAPDIEFTGVMSGAGSTKLALRIPATGVSRWLSIGEGFAGYTVTGYDAKEETALLTKDNVPVRVRLLSSAKVQSVELSATNAPPALAKAITNNLRQIAAAADQYYLENGVMKVTLSDLVGPTKYIRALNPVEGEDYNVLQLREGNGVFSVRTSSGYTVTYDLNPATYTIRAGDTLAMIARQNGVPVQRIVELNQLKDATTIQPGQVLKLK